MEFKIVFSDEGDGVKVRCETPDPCDQDGTPALTIGRAMYEQVLKTLYAARYQAGLEARE